ncbi:MAG: tetratricopeptide repeat protein [Nitrospirota bacterium]
MQETVRLNPRHIGGNFYIGVISGAIGKQAEAIRAFKKVLELQPDHFTAHYNLALIYNGQEDFENAINELKATITYGGDSDEAASARFILSQLGDTLEIVIKSKEYFEQGTILLKKGENEKALNKFLEMIRLVPANVNAHYLSGILYARKGETDKASMEFTKVLEVDPANFLSHYNLGIIYEEKGEYEKAVSEYAAVIKYGGNAPEAEDAKRRTLQLGSSSEETANIKSHFDSGLEFLGEGSLKEALREFNAILSVASKNVSAHFYTGIIYGRMGKTEESFKRFKIAIEIQPKHFPAHYGLGLLYEGRGQYEEAIKEYKETISFGGRSKEASDAKTRLEKLENEIKKISVDKGARTHFNKGIKYFQKIELDKAIKEFKAAIEIEPDNHFFHYNLAVTYTNKNEFSKAFKEFKKAVELKPEHVLSHFRLGLYYLTSFMYKEAKESFEKVIEFGKDEWEVDESKKKLEIVNKKLGEGEYAKGQLEVGKVLFTIGEVDLALLRFEDFLIYNPDYAPAYAYIGDIYYERGLINDAETKYKKAIKLQPKDVSFKTKLAILYKNNDRDKEAIKEYKEIIDVKPDDLLTHFSLGSIYDKHDKYKESLKEYETFISLNKEDKYKERTKHARKRIKELNEFLKKVYVNLNHTMFNYDSNVRNSERDPQSEVYSNLNGNLNYFLLKTKKLAIPLTIATSNTFYYRSQVVVNNDSSSLSLNFKPLNKHLVSLLYSIGYTRTNTGPLSATKGVTFKGDINDIIFSKIATEYKENTSTNLRNSSLNTFSRRYTLNLSDNFGKIGNSSLNIYYDIRKRITTTFNARISQDFSKLKNNITISLNLPEDRPVTKSFSVRQTFSKISNTTTVSYNISKEVPVNYNISTSQNIGFLGSIGGSYRTSRNDSVIKAQNFIFTVYSVNYNKTFWKKLRLKLGYSSQLRRFINPDPLAFRDFGVEVFRKNTLNQFTLNLSHPLGARGNISAAFTDQRNISSLKGSEIDVEELLTQQRESLGSYKKRIINITASFSF